MLSFGMLLDRASRMAVRKRGFPLGSAPPRRAATVISRRMRENSLPRRASVAAFLCLIVLHLLWPDMEAPEREFEGSRFYRRRPPGGQGAFNPLKIKRFSGFRD